MFKIALSFVYKNPYLVFLLQAVLEDLGIYSQATDFVFLREIQNFTKFLENFFLEQRTLNKIEGSLEKHYNSIGNICFVEMLLQIKLHFIVNIFVYHNAGVWKPFQELSALA